MGLKNQARTWASWRGSGCLGCGTRSTPSAKVIRVGEGLGALICRCGEEVRVSEIQTESEGLVTVWCHGLNDPSSLWSENLEGCSYHQLSSRVFETDKWVGRGGTSVKRTHVEGQGEATNGLFHSQGPF